MRLARQMQRSRPRPLYRMGRLFVPCDVLSSEEVFDPPDIEPQAMVLEDMHGASSSSICSHQIVEAERNAGRDTLENDRIHAIDAHADEMRQLGLFAEPVTCPSTLVDDAEIHLCRTVAVAIVRDALFPMKAHELIEVQVGENVAVQNQKRLVEISRRSESGPMVPSGSASCV